MDIKEASRLGRRALMHPGVIISPIGVSFTTHELGDAIIFLCDEVERLEEERDRVKVIIEDLVMELEGWPRKSTKGG